MRDAILVIVMFVGALGGTWIFWDQSIDFTAIEELQVCEEQLSLGQGRVHELEAIEAYQGELLIHCQDVLASCQTAEPEVRYVLQPTDWDELELRLRGIRGAVAAAKDRATHSSQIWWLDEALGLLDFTIEVYSYDRVP
jgi:hypothetical protein